MNRFIITDGNITGKEEINLTHFFWEDPFILTQKMWFGFGSIPFFSENLNTLALQAEALNIRLPAAFSNRQELYRITKRMLNKNRFYRSGVVQITLLLTADRISWMISGVAYPEFEFPFSKHGLLISFADNKKHTDDPLNRFSFYNQPLWKLTEMALKESVFRNSIFLNSKNFVCDAIRANVFMVSENRLITPSLAAGCYEDNLRDIVLELASKTGLQVVESSEIPKNEVFRMNEIFLAGEETGIQWVLGVENKRFVHHYSAIIHEKLNDLLKKKTG